MYGLRSERGSRWSGVAAQDCRGSGLQLGMDDSGDVFSEELKEVSLQQALRALENRFFVGIEPLAGIEIVQSVEFPARYVPERKVIQLNANIARFPKLSQFLIVHELIHHKLALKDPAYVEGPDKESYRAEVRALCRNASYIDLL
jgi:hypothetical protein